MVEVDKKKRIAVDLDGTLTKKSHFPNIWDMTHRELEEIYVNAEPDLEMIQKINKLYDKGFIIYIFTSRNDLHQRQTKKWLEKYNVKHHYFTMNKPYFDFIIDDKAVAFDKIDELFDKSIEF